MNRERALKVVLVIVGLLFLAAVVPIAIYFWRGGGEPAADMMMGSLYVTLGIFLLLAVRNPSANRALIAFAAWSSFAHASVMTGQVLRSLIPRVDLVRAVLPLIIIGVLLIALAPRNQQMERASTAAA